MSSSLDCENNVDVVEDIKNKNNNGQWKFWFSTSTAAPRYESLEISATTTTENSLSSSSSSSTGKKYSNGPASRNNDIGVNGQRKCFRVTLFVFGLLLLSLLIVFIIMNMMMISDDLQPSSSLLDNNNNDLKKGPMVDENNRQILYFRLVAEEEEGVDNTMSTMDDTPETSSMDDEGDRTTSSSLESSSSHYKYVFKILQIADIHLGEAEYRDWGPEQDRKTWIVLDTVITKENPDFIVLSGDQLTGNNCLHNCTEYYKLLGNFLTQYQTPWAIIFGNHDDQDFEVETGNPPNQTVIQRIPHPPNFRKDLMDIDQSFQPLSLSQQGPSDLFGISNYILDIHYPPPRSNRDTSGSDDDNNSKNDPVAAAQIYFFDTGGGALKQQIDESQIRWLKQQQQRKEQYSLPAVAFQHIPTDPTTDGWSHCLGFQGEGVAPLEDGDAGILETLSQFDDGNKFKFIGVGHNHGNDYCCHYKNTTLQLCFGRHSGYGGYGHIERGSRIYELTIPFSNNSVDDDHNDDDDPSTTHNIHNMEWKTWVRLESGEIVDIVDPTRN